MPEPVVVTAMREFKRGLLMREAAQMQEMTRRWLNVERALAAQIETLATEFVRRRAAGETISQAAMYRMGRYKRLLGQTQHEYRGYVGYAGETVTRAQGELARLSLEHATRAIQLSYWPSVGVQFDRLPVEAVLNMVGLAGDGRPVGDLLRRRMLPGGGRLGWDGLVQALVNGTAQGWNPRKTARVMRDSLAEGLQKALVIARSEQLRTYRYVAIQQYQASGVVTGHKRLTAHDDRVCAACLADEGTLYPITVPIPDHAQGRCTGVPVVENMPAVQWTSGVDWFKQQSEDVQRKILGQGKFDAWNDGLFDFSALVTHTQHRIWGGGLTPTPLSQLLN